MTWFLISNVTKAHVDPRKNDRAVKRGDIINIHETCTEPPAPSSIFVLIQVPDLPFEEATLYTTSFKETITEDPRFPSHRPFRVRTKHKRLFRIDLDGLPARHRQNLRATKWTVFDEGRDVFENHIINKRTGQSERVKKSPIIVPPTGVVLPRDWRTQIRN